MSQEQEVKIISTQQFGEIKVEAKYIFDFPDGILGFEDISKFVLISEKETAPFRWMISVENPNIGFPLLNPWLIDPNYNINKHENNQEETMLVVINLIGDAGSITANMKAPIVLDLKNRKGKQIVLRTEKYETSKVINTK